MERGSEYLTFRLDADLKRWLLKQAIEDTVSMSSLVRQGIILLKRLKENGDRRAKV